MARTNDDGGFFQTFSFSMQTKKILIIYSLSVDGKRIFTYTILGIFEYKHRGSSKSCINIF